MKKIILLFFNILIISFVFTINTSIDLYNGSIEIEIKKLNERIQQSLDHNQKIDLLFKVLELKSINNVNAEADIRQLDLLLSKQSYSENHAKADYIIGNILKINGAGNMSIERYNRAYRYYKQKKNLQEQSRLSLAIAENLRAFGEQKKALDYLKQSLNTRKENNDRLSAEIYDRFAAVYFEYSIMPDIGDDLKVQSIRDSCEYFGKKSLAYSTSVMDHQLILSSCTILGALEKSKGNYEKALVYFNKAIHSADLSSRIADKSLILSNIARVYEAQKKDDLALKTILEAYELAVQSNIKIYILMSSEVIYELYKRQKNYEKALYFMEVFHKYHDQIYEENKVRQINLTTTKLELDNRNKEIELQKIKISKQRQGLIILFISLVFIFLLFFVFLYYFVKTKKLNKQLKEEHEKVLALEKLKSVSAMALTANHELNQPLMVFKANLEMLEMSFPVFNDKQKRYLKKINLSYDQMLKILSKYRNNYNMHFENYIDDNTLVVFDDKDIKS